MDAPIYRRRLLAGLALPALLIGLGPQSALAAQPAAAAADTVMFNIPAGPLAAALTAFSAQSRLQVLYGPELTAGRTSPGLTGSWAPEAGLTQLLGDAPAQVNRTATGALVLKAAEGRFPDPATALAIDAEPPTMLETLVVTGSHIRGPGSPASPVTVLDRDQMDRAGHATLAEALGALPQAFNGSGTPTTSLLSADPRGTNDTFATGVNLRGLGTSATLVLIDGRRMAGAGLQGDFADISAIPTAAIRSVDVLLDGASAVYGSDAVGGVVNVRLRQDFDGAESRLRVGGATRGGAGQVQAAHTFGTTWATGGMILAYEYEHREALAARDRDLAATSDLRPFGGTDHRVIYAHPGNILAYDAASGAYVSAYAIPPGQDGRSLKPSDFLAGAANLADPRAGGDLLPDQDRNSLYLGLRQDLTADLTLNLQARASRREIETRRPGVLSVFSVTRANPWFVAPNAATSQTIGYSFADELGPPVTTGASQSLGLTGTLDLDLPHAWRAQAAASMAEETGRRTVRNYLNSAFLNEALGTAADSPLTGFSASRDGYFNPYGTGTATNAPAVLAFIGSGWIHTRNFSRVAALDLQADGPLVALPGGDLKLALGVQARTEAFKPQSASLTSRVTPSLTGGVGFSRQIAAAFVELRAPLIGPENDITGVRSLELSLAGRLERYDDVGTTRNPKLGVVWRLVEGLAVRASYGTSFKAPNLPQVYATPLIAPSFLNKAGANVLSLIQYGGNPDLKPETATSWSAGIDLAPPRLPGLKLSLTGYEVEFEGQIGQPVLSDVDNALTDPAYAPFVHLIDPASAADQARLAALIAASTSPDTGLFPASAYGAIVDARYVNAAKVKVRGVDLEASYTTDLGAGRLDLAGALSYLARFERQITASAGAQSLAGLVGQPSKLRARVSATWTLGTYQTSLGLNRASGAHTAAGRKLDAWTTVDAQLRWSPPATTGPWEGLTLALSVQNLFDADPPFYDSPLGVGYDPANADPIGRQVALQLVKRW